MREPIRVLHILQRMEAAGVQTLLMNIYRNIDRNKVQFDFLVHYTSPQFFDNEIEELGGRIYRLSVREDYNLVKYFNELNSFFRKHEEYKIVHGHMHSLGAFYLRAAKKAGVPVRIAHSHTNSTQNDTKKYLKLFMNKQYARYATDLFACSSNAGNYMFENMPFTVINNAIDSEVFCFDTVKRAKKRAELNVEDKFVVGNVGRFTLQKNQKYSVDVFEEILKKKNNAILLLIGSGPMESEIKAYVKEKGLSEKIRFLGNRRDVAELYMAMDVFLFPSLFEGLGIVGVEAQAAGTPTVCTDTLPQEINVSPLLYRLPLGNASAWAEKVIEASSNPKAHSEMREYIKSADYDIRGISKSIEEFYIARQQI